MTAPRPGASALLCSGTSCSPGHTTVSLMAFRVSDGLWKWVQAKFPRLCPPRTSHKVSDGPRGFGPRGDGRRGRDAASIHGRDDAPRPLGQRQAGVISVFLMSFLVDNVPSIVRRLPDGNCGRSGAVSCWSPCDLRLWGREHISLWKAALGRQSGFFF